MNEKLIKKALDFLLTDYKFSYLQSQCNNYLESGRQLQTYSYYNTNGCFTISCLMYGNEVAFWRFKDVREMEAYFLGETEYATIDFSKPVQYTILEESWLPEIDVFAYEPEIWDKHNKILGLPIASVFWSYGKIVRILTEVIKRQIERNGEFFGIKV